MDDVELTMNALNSSVTFMPTDPDIAVDSKRSQARGMASLIADGGKYDGETKSFVLDKNKFYLIDAQQRLFLS